MVLQILRGALLVIATAVAALYLLANQDNAGYSANTLMLIMIAAILLMGLVILLDSQLKNKKLSSISGVFLGLVAGLVAAFALSFVIDLVGLLTAPEITKQMPDIAVNSSTYFDLTNAQQLAVKGDWVDYEAQKSQHDAYLNLLEGVKILVGLVMVYICISLVLQTKDDFRFVIPYVEFSKQIRGNRPTLVDSSVIIDGRIIDIIETRIMQGTLVVPRFILNELQMIADSTDKLKRARGRRGLDVLKQIQDSKIIDVHIDDTEVEESTVDQKLIALAQQLQSRVMTNDYNLNKIAQLRGVDVININDLSQALRPVVLPGERMNVKIVKPGEGQSQGVGYLDDGTMVVVEQGKYHVGKQCDIIVTSMLQTSAGRMIFGKIEGDESDNNHQSADAASSQHNPRNDRSGGYRRQSKAAHKP